MSRPSRSSSATRQYLLLPLLFSAVLLLSQKLGSVAAEGEDGGRVLLLRTDDTKYDRLVDWIEGMGFEVDEKNEKESTMLGGHKPYTDLIITTDTLGSLRVNDILVHIEGGGSLTIVSSPSASRETRKLIKEYGIVPAPKDYRLFDHINFDTNGEGNQKRDRVLASTGLAGSWLKRAGYSFDGSPILAFNTSVQSVGEDNKFTSHALLAPETSYSGTNSTLSLQKKKLMGSTVNIATATQTQQNARVVVLGSSHLCTDETFYANMESEGGDTMVRYGNEAFCKAALKWTLGLSGKLRTSGIQHMNVDTGASDGYKVKDVMSVSMKIEEKRDLEWVGFEAAGLQVELVMLDPYIRKTFDYQGDGSYTTQFQLPDTYGVFKLVVKHEEFGVSWIDVETPTPLRPFRTDEYDRFIPMQIPYYATAYTCMAGVLVLCVAFLYSP